VLFTVLGELDATPQRHAGWLARRFPIMNSRNVRYGLAGAVAAILLAFAGWQFLPAVNVGPPPDPTPTPAAEETPAAAPSVAPLPTVNTPLSGGRYSVDIGEGDRHWGIELDVPDGWVGANATANQAAIQPAEQDYFPFVGFYSVRRVFNDPCHPEFGMAGDHNGPTARELVGALMAYPNFTIGEASTESIGGLEATHFTISNEMDTEARDCTDDPWLSLFVTWDGRRVEGGIARTVGRTSQDLWIVSRGGEFDPNPLLIVTETGTLDSPGTQLDRDAIDRILSSITFH
jgi:hypothetical protein